LTSPATDGERIPQRLLKRCEHLFQAIPECANIYIRVINTWLAWLKEEDEFLEYAWKIEKLSEPKGIRREIFTPEIITALSKFKPTNFDMIRTWTLAMLIFDTGLRIEDALKLAVADIDYDSDILKIIGKGNKQRHVPFTKSRGILNKYILKTMPKTAKYVFGTATGNVANYRNILYDLGIIEERAGVQKLSWHSFRHNFATGYIANGGDIYRLQRILGHTDIRTTTIYLHMLPSYVTDKHESFSSMPTVLRIA
jgi:site-specific recombinase XerD